MKSKIEINNKTQEDIRQFFNDTSELSAKPVHYVLADLIREKNPQEEHLADTVEKLCPHKYCGYIKYDFEWNGTKYHINIQLTKSSDKYKPDIMIPNDEHAKELFNQYNNLKFAAMAYFAKFMSGNEKLIDDIQRAIDCKLDLKIDENNQTSLYFNKESRSRISILPYYVNDKGEPYKKK